MAVKLNTAVVEDFLHGPSGGVSLRILLKTEQVGEFVTRATQEYLGAYLAHGNRLPITTSDFITPGGMHGLVATDDGGSASRSLGRKEEKEHKFFKPALEAAGFVEVAG